MDKPDTFLVTKTDTRSNERNGDRTQCFYCKGTLGKPHDPDCVCRQRTVVVQATIAYVVHVPQDWTKEQIEFQRNEGSWCANNMLRELHSALEDGGCLCLCTDFQFVREASEGDEDTLPVASRHR